MQLYQGVGELRGAGEIGRLSNVGVADRLRHGPMGIEDENPGGVAETRIVRLIEPLKERRRILLASKEMHQVTQDLEDEIVSLSLSAHFPPIPQFFCKDPRNHKQKYTQYVFTTMSHSRKHEHVS